MYSTRNTLYKEADMFFGTQKLKDEIESLTVKLSSKEHELGSSIEKIREKDRELNNLILQNNQLQTTINELEAQLKVANTTTNTQTSTDTVSESLHHLLTSENEHLKLGLLDIQANLAESTDLARENLNNTNNVKTIFKDSSVKMTYSPT